MRTTFLSMMLLAAPALAQPLPNAFSRPWTDVAPRIEAGVVRTAAVGVPDARIGRFEARRVFARAAGRDRALAALHAWADDALAGVRADPRLAQAAHAAIDREAHVDGVRPLVDGGAVVVVSVPITALRSACGVRGLPWSR